MSVSCPAWVLGFKPQPSSEISEGSSLLALFPALVWFVVLLVFVSRESPVAQDELPASTSYPRLAHLVGSKPTRHQSCFHFVLFCASTSDPIWRLGCDSQTDTLPLTYILISI